MPAASTGWVASDRTNEKIIVNNYKWQTVPQKCREPFKISIIRFDGIRLESDDNTQNNLFSIGEEFWIPCSARLVGTTNPRHSFSFTCIRALQISNLVYDLFSLFCEQFEYFHQRQMHV